MGENLSGLESRKISDKGVDMGRRVPYSEAITNREELMVNLSKVLEAAGPFGIEPFTRAELRAVKDTVAAYRERYGFKRLHASLLTEPKANVKLSKSLVGGWSLSLAPANTSGVANVCAYSTPVCRKYCVAYTGNGGFPAVARARAWKTAFLSEQPQLFIRLLAHEIRNASKRGQITMRLNTFSDLRWERIAPDLFSIPNVSFYDYTKWPLDKRINDLGYHLTASATERTSIEDIQNIIAAGGNVAVVASMSRFKVKPDTWEGMPAIDGDSTDDRTTDPKGVVVLLTAKGKLRTATDKASRKFRHDPTL